MSRIEEAIHGRRRLAFVYRGKPRLVEPHTYGEDRHGRLVLVGVQVGGEASDALPAWRGFHVAAIRHLVLLDDAFRGPRDGYRRDDGAFTKIYAQL